MSYSVKHIFLFLSAVLILQSCYNLNPPEKIREPSAYYFYQMALQFRIQGHLKKALNEINKAIKINDHISLFYVLKAQIFDSLQVLDSAVYYYKHSLIYRSHSPEVLKRLAELSFQKGNLQQAIRYYRKAYIEEPDSVNFLLNIAQLYLKENNLEKAQLILDEYRLTQERNDRALASYYYIYSADLALAKGDSLKAARNYAQSHCGACLSTRQAEWAFKTLLTVGNLDAYYELLSGVVKNRNFPEGLLFYYRGLYYLAIGNRNEAMEQFERAYTKGLRKRKLLQILLQYYRTSNREQRIKQLQEDLDNLKD